MGLTKGEKRLGKRLTSGKENHLSIGELNPVLSNLPLYYMMPFFVIPRETLKKLG
jgi:hypothetical protein